MEEVKIIDISHIRLRKIRNTLLQSYIVVPIIAICLITLVVYQFFVPTFMPDSVLDIICFVFLIILFVYCILFLIAFYHFSLLTNTHVFRYIIYTCATTFIITFITVFTGDNLTLAIILFGINWIINLYFYYRITSVMGMVTRLRHFILSFRIFLVLVVLLNIFYVYLEITGFENVMVNMITDTTTTIIVGLLSFGIGIAYLSSYIIFTIGIAKIQSVRVLNISKSFE